MMTANELNAAIASGGIDEIIAVAEARQRKCLGKIADEICARAGARLVLLAGGSSSGKTTTAKRLCTQLRVDERTAMLLSTDDYFVGDQRNPRDANGKLDYEHVECVDIPRLAADMNALLAGECVMERRFDFVNHVPTYTGRMLSLPAEGVIVIEGIHALNPRLTEGIDDAVKFRLAIDPHPSLELSTGSALTSSDARFLRRLVRDRHFRNVNPQKTLDMWPDVLAGERKWIDPFRPLADATFDSYLVYELAVLKRYAGGLLEYLRREFAAPEMAVTMLKVLDEVKAIDDTKVPGDSILRETIGGSQLEY